ncbi:ribosomal protection-like ABC-F family protein [Sutcliffiella horikoshii]|uniref:ribosomal protection-like ABC-F family protein n=1 Tax=Sutcliffiella horikoshii TaxID=79883 RepID=UPI001EEF44B0|nr:ABC-F type ribosomal protection protein [Sutcliffiella horikoshii]MCG1020335.1 ABC-F type ribosomal protection protein [Sutcliffiella horikoshii]
MTMILQVKQVNKSFGERDILKDISFDIKNGEKIGLVGWNGAGKTTLMKLLMGSILPDSGSISTFPVSLKIGYLPQSTDYTIHTEKEMREDAKDLLRAASEMGLVKSITRDGASSGTLSGGERLKLALAKIWSQSPQLLCLDEPTNHMDMKGVNWLVSELKKFAGSAIIISHDRYFLDKTVSKIYEIEDCKLMEYEGNYTAYRQEKQRRLDQQARDYGKQQRKIKLIEDQVANLKQWSEKAHREAGKRDNPGERKQMGLKEFERVKAKKKDNQIKSKTKRLELELSKHKVEKPKEEIQVKFEFETDGKRGKRILEAKGLTKHYGERLLFEKSHFYVKHGERIGLIGENGAGKTTFIKMLMEQESTTKGSLWKSSSLKIAYLSQEVSDMPLGKNAMEYLDLIEWERVSKARTIFANMGMHEEKLTKPLNTLSLGEKTRVKLVHMIMQEYDVLILDEPTNHLDLPSREQMEATLSTYTGTLIVISHDRYFIEKLCDKLLVIENKRIKRVETGLLEYEDSKKKQVSPSEKETKEKIAVLEAKITELLGKISMVNRDSQEYFDMDDELHKLMQLKRELA